ncbi:MAG: hypothetical protein U1F71_12570 [Verrucomicrobiaceae bacterium]
MISDAISLEDMHSTIFRDQVLQARRMTEGERLQAGLEQGDFSTGMMLSGVKMDFPEADDRTALTILRQRLAILRRVEEQGHFIPAEAA